MLSHTNCDDFFCSLKSITKTSRCEIKRHDRKACYESRTTTRSDLGQQPFCVRPEASEPSCLRVFSYNIMRVLFVAQAADSGRGTCRAIIIFKKNKNYSNGRPVEQTGATFAAFSVTLNLTISFTVLNGIGQSIGN